MSYRTCTHCKKDIGSREDMVIITKESNVNSEDQHLYMSKRKTRRLAWFHTHCYAVAFLLLKKKCKTLKTKE